MADKYYFHLFSETSFSDDQVGRICSDLLIAFQYAVQIAFELSVDEEDWGTVIEVCDSDRSAIAWFCSGKTVITTRPGELATSADGVEPIGGIGWNSPAATAGGRASGWAADFTDGHGQIGG